MKRLMRAFDTQKTSRLLRYNYLLMYLALVDKNEALTLLSSQRDEFIDDGNSRTYLRAWIYAQ